MNKTGKFITIEGVEGAGKSTQMAYIENALKGASVDLVVTREPGGTPLGEEIRELLLRPRDSGMSERAELLLMFAARAEHLANLIEPALEHGQWILCDRFTDATYAYQGGGRGLDKTLIAQLETLAQGNLRPDITIYLDVSIEVGMQRARLRGELDRFEQEDMDFFNRVRQTYLDRAGAFPEVYRVIDASVSIEDVQSQIDGVIEQLLESR
ncbi:MAG: dTMP kinase [Gammaproteobacteria bacterium]|nr:MAG: dTMP kinase [Gammaproteobacteria bacterium]